LIEAGCENFIGTPTPTNGNIGSRARGAWVGQARTFDFQSGDVGCVPFAMGHYIENTGTTTLRHLEIFKSSYFADLSLNQWMALTPRNWLRRICDSIKP
jgi:oxalate decarboxylase/phosphoglucose isomerase-like protein (cupin superfamily)